MSACRSCGADILWIETEIGKAMPIDATPEKRIILRPVGGTSRVGKVVDTYISHFATCPEADQHRRKP
jgi:hypothetical protein